MPRSVRISAWCATFITIGALVLAGAVWRAQADTVAMAVHGLSVAVTAGAMIAAARRGDPRLRRSRMFFAAALISTAVGFAINGVYEAVVGTAPIPSPGDVAVVAWVPCTIVGLLLMPSEVFRQGGRARAICDAVGCAAALFLGSWLLVLKPIYDQTTQTGLAKATLLAYPVVDVLVAVTALSVASHARRDTRRLLRLISAGLLLIAINDSGRAFFAALGTIEFNWTNLVLQAGLLLLLWAALLPASSSDNESIRPLDALIDAALPHAPVVAVMVIGLNHTLRGGIISGAEAAVGAVMVAALLARQLLYAKHLSSVAHRLSIDASHDALTGLVNRRAFVAALDAALSDLSAGNVAVTLIDLDGFKEVNDGFGHLAGDLVLQEFARRLHELRDHAPVAARLGGDEFALLLRGVDAEKLAIAAGQSFTRVHRIAVGSAHVAVGASAGVAASLPGDTTSLILRRADLALYDAKSSPGPATRLFADDMARRAERRHLLAQSLPGAGARGELHLVYQPLYRLADQTIAGAEALLRWNHPVHGDVPPDEFIPLAEEVGAIVEIGEWVLRTAAADLVALADKGRDLRQLFVNVSAHQLTDGFADLVSRVMTEYAIQPGVLTLEMTESAMPSLQANVALQDLRRAGVPIAMDDFGAGFSSLAQLALLHVDILKMDSDLIRATSTTNGRRVVDSVIALANDLGLTTVAEGVETKQEAAVVAQSACALAQGYHFAAPMIVADLLELLPRRTLPHAAMV